MIADLLKQMVHQVEDKPVLGNLSWAAWLQSFDVNTIIKVPTKYRLCGYTHLPDGMPEFHNRSFSRLFS